MNLLAALLDGTTVQTTSLEPLPLIRAAAVTRYHFPLVTYGQRLLDADVNVGDEVVAGQSLAEGIISSVSGTVEHIDRQPFAHPSGMSVLSVTVNAAAALAQSAQGDTTGSAATTGSGAATSDLTIDRLRRCGVSGLGGAGYSTADKFAAILQHDIHTLLINAAECDPDIRCDEALMNSEPDALVRGIRQLMALSQCQHCIIAIENDKSDAIAALRSALENGSDSNHCANIELRLIEPVYPSGAERILIRLTCGIDVVPPMRPAEHGVLCVNVATAYAAGRAADGYAQTTRIVTISGPAAAHPCNVVVRLGTPIVELLELSGNHYDAQRHRLRIGGGISGFELHDVRSPITVRTNCVTLEARTPKPLALPCIRCGACSDACPVQLLPQQLYWHIQAGDLDGAARQRVDHCIECACCDQVCPSAIELTSAFRHARSQRRADTVQRHEAELARARHESHAKREAAREALAQEQIRARKAALNDRAAASAAALERVRNRRKRPPT